MSVMLEVKHKLCLPVSQVSFSVALGSGLRLTSSRARSKPEFSTAPELSL